MRFWYEFFYFILETSNPDQTDTSMDNTDEITGLPSACDQSTQTEDVLDLTKEQSKEDISKDQGSTLPSHSQNETEVWSLISFKCYLQSTYFFVLKSNTWNIFNICNPLTMFSLHTGNLK